MFTRCPNCRAAFSITDQQLEIATGMVRCSMCEHVFNAQLYLFDQSSDDSQNIDITLEPDDSSNIDLEFLDKQLHGFEDTHQGLRPQQQEEIPATTNNVESTAQEPLAPKVIAGQVSNLENESTPLQSLRWLGSISIVALVAAVLLQIATVVKPEIVPAQFRSRVCQWLTCVNQIPRALDEIEVLNRSIYTHPNENNALMVTVTIVNRAQFAQPYPIIHLRFLNVARDVIATRQFGSNHYLDTNWQPKRLMESNIPLSIKLEVQDVGKEVVSYDFDFL